MTRQAKLFIAGGFVLVFVLLMLIKTKPITKSDDRVWQAYLKAEAPILVPGSGTASATRKLPRKNTREQIYRNNVTLPKQ